MGATALCTNCSIRLKNGPPPSSILFFSCCDTVTVRLTGQISLILGMGKLCHCIKWHKTRFFEQKICHQIKNMPPNTPFYVKEPRFSYVILFALFVLSTRFTTNFGSFVSLR